MHSTKENKPVTGTHILGELFTQISDLSVVNVKPLIASIIREEGLTEVGATYHAFTSGGFTAVIALAESHIAIHTWPEFDYVTLDVFICNYTKNNFACSQTVFKRITEIFKPERIVQHTTKR